MKDLFTDIYKNNLWNGKESVSGVGSDSDQTMALVPLINAIFKNFDITSIVDLPCGDFNWMQKVDLSDKKYIGVDIVDELITSNNELYSSANIEFISGDIFSFVIPEVDVLIIRDLLGHLSQKHIQDALTIVKRSKAKYLLSTTYTNREIRYEIETGGWHPINLDHYLSSPIATFNEGCTDVDQFGAPWWDKSLGLWSIQEMKTKFIRK